MHTPSEAVGMDYRARPSTLRILSRSARGPATVALCGELDALNRDAVRRSLAVIGAGEAIDLTRVTFLAAAGLTELARVARRAPPRSIALTGAHGIVRRVLEMAQFERLFAIL